MKHLALKIPANFIANPICLFVFAALAVSLCALTSAGDTNGADPQCTVCHKRTTTLMFSCASLDYQRHIDHGDPMTACNVTPTENP